MIGIPLLLKARRRGHLIPVKKTYMRDGKMVTATVWINPTDEKARGTLSLFADEVIKTPKKVVDIDSVFKEKEGNKGASGNKKKKEKEKSQGDLFVDAGMGEELKEQWREKKRNRHIDYLQEPWNEGKPRWMFTLEDYAELDTLGGKRLSDMSPEEIKKESGLHTMDLGKGKHNWSPPEEAPLQEHIDHLKYFINDLVDLYRETNGKYGKKGEMTHRRQIHQALKAGLPVPPEVLEDYVDLKEKYMGETAGPQVMDEEEYLDRHGATKTGIGEAGLHRNTNQYSYKVWHRMVLRQAEKDLTLIEKRDRLRKEYQEKVIAGELRPRTRIERLELTAQGHPDNESTKAAKRVLEKLRNKGVVE